MKSSQALLSVEGLGRQLGDRWLWRGVNFELFSGDCVGLVAPSGAGKTLLMRNLVLLDPLQQGEVRLEGKPLSAWSLPAYRSRVMYVPQRATPIGILVSSRVANAARSEFDGTVQDNLKQVFELGVHRQRQFDPDIIHTWLARLGRGPEFLSLQGARLSGGEAQILALLRSLQLDPQVLLLDEPTASLDAATTASVEALLHDWLQHPHRACLMTSHDAEQIHRFTHRQLDLRDFA
ncbi:ATP-binding cassette domain-containing protein [Nodosilinea sp. LEGE 06152]|uniref:ABC transporter ATP-binding protein n=1 Tax=Nodosilinea sp. LEGE 06152 TaxID=2777966 RepID=UPI0018803A18|nr:ATP-binding cassette domain-containing protein [Nodosilinea sp. LEGE 06152]MBE9156644.1 ATP-binding cassette domain-containing protein [Nodosilinea sp. LEGE 06152]MBE9160491.1 ATP-binding cassette domain-containing protein [Nodosilinea sp. LEGE 06152]